MTAIPIALVTDVGRDIDDTLALLALLGAQRQRRIRLVGIATSGGLTRTRACVARGYLRAFGIADEDVPIAFGPYETKQPPGCYVPGNFPQGEDVALEEEDGASLLIRLAKCHGSQLRVICIGPTDPLADAAVRDPEAMRSIGAIYFQGQAVVEVGDFGETTIRPDMASFNFRESPEAASSVFSILQRDVPMHFMGKFAAYRVSLTRSDVQEMEASTSLQLLDILKRTMNTFREGNPELFYQLYPVAVEHRTDGAWFEHMPHLSHPYDPLSVLQLLAPELFSSTRVRCGEVEHELVGATQGQDGVASPVMVMRELMRCIDAANANRFEATATVRRRSYCHVQRKPRRRSTESRSTQRWHNMPCSTSAEPRSTQRRQTSYATLGSVAMPAPSPDI